MADDFGSRGDLQQLPLLNHDNDRPTKVEDRTLADVIIESFDSLTTTFDEFTKHLETLNKRDVYEATKQAIIDTNANGGGRGGTPTNVTINDTLTKNFEEVKRYWLAKAQREEAHLKQQQKDEEERAKKQLEATQRATMDGFLKWTNQALTNNPIAFLQDFMWKKVFEPFIMRLGNAPEQKKEEERKAKQEKEKDRQEEDKREKSRQENLESLLKTNSEYIVDGFDKSLKTNLQGFADDLTQFAGMLFSGRMGGGNQGGINRMGISPMGTAIGQRALGTDIDAQDDVEDMQKASDDTTALITEPESTEFGSAILDALNKDAEETEKKEEEKEDSLLDKLFNNPMMMGLLKFGLLVTGVTYIVRVLTDVAQKFKDFKKGLPRFLGGDGNLSTLPVNVIDSKDAEVKNLSKIISSDTISDKMFDIMSDKVEASLLSDSDESYAFSIEGGDIRKSDTYKLRQTDFADLLNESNILSDKDLAKRFKNIKNLGKDSKKDKSIVSFLQKYEAKRMAKKLLGRDLTDEELNAIDTTIDYSGNVNAMSTPFLGTDNLDKISRRLNRIKNSVNDSFTWSGYGGTMLSTDGGKFSVLDTEITDEHLEELNDKELTAVAGNAFISFNEKKEADYNRQLAEIDESKLSDSDKAFKRNMLFKELSPTFQPSQSISHTMNAVNMYTVKHTEDCDIGGGR